MQTRQQFVGAVNNNASMKELKRIFGMTKEQVDYNLKIISYHRMFLSVANEMRLIRADNSLNNREKRDRIKKLRDELVEEWKRVNQ